MRSETLDLNAIRMQHTLILLRKLWYEDISRAELSRRIGLSRSAISSIVSELLDVNLVLELGLGASLGGRKPTILRLNENAAYLLAVDIGKRHLGVALLDLRCNIIEETTCEHHREYTPEDTYDELDQVIQGFKKKHPGKVPRIAMIGVSIAGPVNYKTGQVIQPPNLPSWNEEQVASAISRRFGIPTFVDNDANLGALAELHFSGLSDQHLIYLKCATGIGAGILIDGKIYRGVSGGAGEIGHTSINENGPVGPSGYPGSLESYVSGAMLLKRMLELLPQYPQTCLRADSTLQQLALAAKDGDELATRIVEDAGRHLGIAIANVVNLFSPSEVILGGDLCLAEGVLLDPLKQMLEQRTMLINREQTNVRLTRFNTRTSLYGAGVLALYELFDPNGLKHLYEVAKQPLLTEV
ncbi:ROK family transcriptional regulator [Deinococcus cellulosilyticus]|uniref:Transcriptional regulator n=1 Tax=Deinococcus cellulosilyticus (strain DSM 18568 / NBRC 106333 / KACC 11606 / 5516J-15) TaxID=1223518 RepID=A0A511MZT2_DEIC1|nr:ROK family protein [Deinococcus cellulosilyticus]GEM45707.1 transcriptional regulator [Deinococcus cellulosilyticus NBRC 106333 = KACC 11606]